MNRSIRYRLYPTTEQQILFAKTFGCCRKVWNLMLSDAIDEHEKSGKFLCNTPARYKDEYPYLREVDSLALANKWMDLRAAFRSCFDKSRKKRSGFPKFKALKRSRKTYTTNNQNGTVALTENSIRLPKAGFVRAVIHRKPEDGWRLKSATISQEPDGSYYASVLFEYDAVPVERELDMNNAIGLDYASDGLYVDSNGDIGSNHKYYSESHKKLAMEQRRLSRKQGPKGDAPASANYEKQLRKVDKIHAHIANQRRDNLHKTSTEIANRYDVVCVESLNMQQIAEKRFKLGKATHDNGYGTFLSMLEYKLADRGKPLIRVDKWFPSSQICHQCGLRHPEMKNLRIRKMKCSCGIDMGRDQNAAINILREGLRLLSESV